MGKLDGKVAVITAATSGMALATAKLFVQEGAYVFITGRRQDKLDEAVKAIGRNVTGVQGDAANLADLDRLYETVKKEKGRIDVLFASAGRGDLAKIGDVTEEQFDTTFDLNVRGTLFTVQKALPLFTDGGSIFLNGFDCKHQGFPGVWRLCRQQSRRSVIRAYVARRSQGPKDPRQYPEPGNNRHPDSGSSRTGGKRILQNADSTRRNGTAGRDRNRGVIPCLQRFKFRERH